MANDKNNINELVTDDDDPTAELEILTSVAELEQEIEQHSSESSADTAGFVHDDASPDIPTLSDLRSDLQNRSDTIDRLQFDIEQLHAKWTGLETEIKAREEQTESLHKELSEARDKLARNNKLLKKRDASIKSLKAEIRTRNDDYGELRTSLIEKEEHLDQLQQELSTNRTDEIQQSQTLLEEQAGQISSMQSEIAELRAQLERNESYADSLRQQIQERAATTDEAEDTKNHLQQSLDKALTRIEELRTSLNDSNSKSELLREKLDGLQEAHAEEIRTVRFELGEAQETVVQHELVTEQLASDLVDTRGFRDELESMLNKSIEDNSSRIEQLEKDNQKLLHQISEKDQKLETKTEAITCLLAELAKKSEQIESIGGIEDVIHDIDDRMSERIDERGPKDKERVTRVLIGTVDGQELRFPLFKDRLTIGRTAQNDIHLNASYVSRRHAVIVSERDVTRVIDWGSKNGVMVNSKRISEHFLQNGDTVTIGTAEFRYEERAKRDS